jgi:hypothetical protein
MSGFVLKGAVAIVTGAGSGRFTTYPESELAIMLILRMIQESTLSFPRLCTEKVAASSSRTLPFVQSLRNLSTAHQKNLMLPRPYFIGRTSRTGLNLKKSSTLQRGSVEMCPPWSAQARGYMNQYVYRSHATNYYLVATKLQWLHLFAYRDCQLTRT